MAARGLSRIRTPLKEFSWLSVSSQLEVAVSFVSSVLVVRYLGATEAGQVFFAMSLAGVVMMILDPRVEDTIQRYFPLLREKGHADSAPAFLWGLVILDAVVGGLVVLSGLVLLLVSPLPESPVFEPSYVGLCLISAGALAAQGSLQAAFAVAGQLIRLAKLRITLTVIGAPVWIAALTLYGPVAFLCALATVSLFSLCSLIIFASREVPMRWMSPRQLRLQLPEGVASFTFKSSLATSIASGGDNAAATLSGLIGGPDVVVFLKISFAPARFLLSLASPIASQVFPRSSRLAAQGMRHRAAEMCLRISRTIALPIMMVLIVAVPLMPTVLGLVYGPPYSVLGTAALLGLAGAALRAIVVWSKVLPLALGRPGLRMTVMLVDSLAFLASVALLAHGPPLQAASQILLAYAAISAAGMVYWLATARRWRSIPPVAQELHQRT